jgi:hypothetical protein
VTQPEVSTLTIYVEKVVDYAEWLDRYNALLQEAMPEQRSHMLRQMYEHIAVLRVTIRDLEIQLDMITGKPT